MAPKFFTASEYFSKIAKTVYLYKNIWREESTALLHGPGETNKAEEALDIAADIARNGREVVYVACDSSIATIANRLTSAPKGLKVCRPSFDSPEDERDYADMVIATIEEIAKETSVRTFVVDSVTRIAALSFGRNASAAYVMKRLVILQMRYRLSLLVISHDTTKAVDRALNVLADAVIAVEPVEEAVAAKKGQEKPGLSNAEVFSQKSRHLRSSPDDGSEYGKGDVSVRGLSR